MLFVGAWFHGYLRRINSTAWNQDLGQHTFDQGDVSQDAGQSLRLQMRSLGGMASGQLSSGRILSTGGFLLISCTHSTRRDWCPPPQIAEHGPKPWVFHLQWCGTFSAGSTLLELPHPATFLTSRHISQSDNMVEMGNSVRKLHD